MTPSLSGRMAVMLPGVLPSISLATSPTALPSCKTRLVPFLTATTLGSFSTMPSPLTHTSVLHVPRSMPMSILNIPNSESKITLDTPCQLPGMFDLWPAGRPDAEEGHPLPEFAHPCHGASIHSPAIDWQPPSRA